MDWTRMRITGRCVEDGGILWLTFPLCEVAFEVQNATFLRICLVGEDRRGDPDRIRVAPRFAVDVNGQRVLDERLTEERKTCSVFEGPRRERTLVRLVKLSECTQSILGIETVETDGELFQLPEQRLRLEFIGDSITCGYGVEAACGEESFSTATENAEKSYAGLTAAALNAAPMLTAFSGHGIVSGYTDDPEKPNLKELVPPYYESMGRQEYILPSGRRLEDIPWDFSRFRPHAIVLNLGTNDLSWCGEKQERQALFAERYSAFLQTVRGKNPGVPILCVLGLMGTGLNRMMLQAVEDYQARTGDSLIRAIPVEEQDMVKNGAGADYHPSEITQRLFADRMIAELEAVIGQVS